MSKNTIPFAQLNSPLQREWKRDRRIRQRIPFEESFRGCLGLAAMWANVDDCECVGNRILYSSENLTWLCLRDIPPGHFPTSRCMNGRDVNFVSTAKAKLRYGMPILDFAQPTREMWDFRKLPYGCFRIQKASGVDWRMAAGYTLNADEHPREFAVLNKVSRAMTTFAFFSRAEDGQSVRRPWARKRPRGRAIPIVPPQEWFPIPYLGFEFSTLRRLLRSRIWLACSSKVIKLKTRRDRLFLPASVCDQLIHEASPVELMWDTDAWELYIDADLEAAVFPPIRLRHWHALRMNLHHTRLNCQLGDPLFSRTKSLSLHRSKLLRGRDLRTFGTQPVHCALASTHPIDLVCDPPTAPEVVLGLSA